MKPWQVIAIVLLAVVGVALVVYFATRRDAPTEDVAEGEGGSANRTADTISGVGSGLTGVAASFARAFG